MHHASCVLAMDVLKSKEISSWENSKQDNAMEFIVLADTGPKFRSGQSIGV